MRLKLSQEMPPNASGVTNSVARTRPNRSTTVSQKIAERIQCRAAPSGNVNRPALLSEIGAGSRNAAPGPVVDSDIPRARRYLAWPRTTLGMTELSSGGHFHVISVKVALAQCGSW